MPPVEEKTIVPLDYIINLSAFEGTLTVASVWVKDASDRARKEIAEDVHLYREGFQRLRTERERYLENPWLDGRVEQIGKQLELLEHNCRQYF